MPRISRKSIKTPFFHVMTQGINKSYIFKNDVDKKFYIKKLYILAPLQNVQIDAYCIMGNHSHLLLKSDSTENLSKLMQLLNSKYSQYYNNKYNRVGHVFRDRFRSEGIYTEMQYNCCIKYIFNNPVKAGICISADKYPYSNYRNTQNSNNENNEEFTFIDIKEEPLDLNLIQIFLKEKNLSINDLEKDETILKEVIIFLKNHNFSLRKIANETNINREKIRLLYQKTQ